MATKQTPGGAFNGSGGLASDGVGVFVLYRQVDITEGETYAQTMVPSSLRLEEVLSGYATSVQLTEAIANIDEFEDAALKALIISGDAVNKGLITANTARINALPAPYSDTALRGLVTSNTSVIASLSNYDDTAVKGLISTEATERESADTALGDRIDALPGAPSNTPDILMGFTNILTDTNGTAVFNAALSQTQSVGPETADTIVLNLLVPSEGLTPTHLTIVSTRLINIDKVEASEFGQLFAEDDDFATPTLVVVEGISYYIYQSVAEEITSGASTWKITYDLSSGGGISDEDRADIDKNIADIKTNRDNIANNIVTHTRVLNSSFQLSGEWTHPKLDNVSEITFTFMIAGRAEEAATLLNNAAIGPLDVDSSKALAVIRVELLGGNRVTAYLEGTLSVAASSSGSSLISIWQTVRNDRISRIIGGDYLLGAQSLRVIGPSAIVTLRSDVEGAENMVNEVNDRLLEVESVANTERALNTTNITLKANITDTYTRTEVNTRLSLKLDVTDLPTPVDISGLLLDDLSNISQSIPEADLINIRSALNINKRGEEAEYDDGPLRDLIALKANTSMTYTQTQINGQNTAIMNSVTANTTLANTKLSDADGAVGTDNIANGSITSRKIQNGTISHDDLGTDSVLADNIGNGQIQTYHLSLNAVHGDRIQDNTIPESKLSFDIPDPVDISGKANKDFSNIPAGSISQANATNLRVQIGAVGSQNFNDTVLLKADKATTYTRDVTDDLLDEKLDVEDLGLPILVASNPPIPIPFPISDITFIHTLSPNTLRMVLDNDSDRAASAAFAVGKFIALTSNESGVVTTHMVTGIADLESSFSVIDIFICPLDSNDSQSEGVFIESSTVTLHSISGGKVVGDVLEVPSPDDIIIIENQLNNKAETDLTNVTAIQWAGVSATIYGALGLESSRQRTLARELKANADLTNIHTDLTEPEKTTFAGKVGLASSRPSYQGVFTGAQGSISAPIQAVVNTHYLYLHVINFTETMYLPENPEPYEEVEIISLTGSLTTATLSVRILPLPGQSLMLDGVDSSLTRTFSTGRGGHWRFTYTGVSTLGWIGSRVSGGF